MAGKIQSTVAECFEHKIGGGLDVHPKVWTD